MAFRDDREALLSRVTALENELAAERGGAETQQALAAELDTLRAQVRAATGELEQDRAALLEVGAALDRLRARVAPPAPARAAAAEPVPAGRQDGPPPADANLAMVLVIGAGLALIVALVLLLGGRRRRTEHSVSPAPEVEVEVEVEARERVAAPPVPTEVTPTPERYSCDVLSKPPGAELRRDGVVLGKTPLRIYGDDDVGGYVLHRNGYRDVALKLTPGPDCKLEIVLQQQGPP